MRPGSCMSRQGSCTTPAPDKQGAAPAAGAGQGFDSQLVTPSWGSPKGSGQGWDSSTTRHFTNTTFLVLPNQHQAAAGRGEAPLLSLCNVGSIQHRAGGCKVREQPLLLHRLGRALCLHSPSCKGKGSRRHFNIKLVTRCNTLIFNNVTFIKRRTFFA